MKSRDDECNCCVMLSLCSAHPEILKNDFSVVKDVDS